MYDTIKKRIKNSKKRLRMLKKKFPDSILIQKEKERLNRLKIRRTAGEK